MYCAKEGLAVLSTLVLLAGCATTSGASISAVAEASSSAVAEASSSAAECPISGTSVPLAKAMNPSFIDSYRNCDITVEADFVSAESPSVTFSLPSGPGGYDITVNTAFNIAPPGGAGQTTIAAGLPKSKADILFELQTGERIILRGAPIGYRSAGGTFLFGVFHAHSIERAR